MKIQCSRDVENVTVTLFIYVAANWIRIKMKQHFNLTLSPFYCM